MYKTREASLEEALVETSLAGVSVRRVEDITEALWGTRMSRQGVAAQPGDLSRDRSLAQPRDRRSISLREAPI